MKVWQNIEESNMIQKHPGLFEFAKFAIVGVSGTIVDFGIYTILTRVFDTYYIAATAISVFIAILNNFLLNKYWTFNRGQSGRTKSEYGKFFIVSAVNYALNLGITYGVVEFTASERWFGANEDFFAKIIAIAVVLFSNYLGNKYWTFRDTE